MLNSRNKSCFHKRSVAGFTLLEVLVALAIIAIVFVSVLRLQGQTISMDDSVRFYSVAPFLAQAKMSEVISNPSEYTGGSSGDFGDDAPGYSWQVNIDEIKLTGPENAILDMMDAVVTVRRASDGLKYQLKAYLPDTGDTSL